jgi:hypothetical protein
MRVQQHPLAKQDVVTKIRTLMAHDRAAHLAETSEPQLFVFDI